jgi:hypothetical protein
MYPTKTGEPEGQHFMIALLIDIHPTRASRRSIPARVDAMTDSDLSPPTVT